METCSSVRGWWVRELLEQEEVVEVVEVGVEQSQPGPPLQQLPPEQQLLQLPKQ
jgi:hypothetical protein